MKATIYSIKEAAPNRIAIVARPRGGDWLCDELSALSQDGIDILVSMLTAEETDELGLLRESEECEAAAIEFVNLPIPDRSVPLDRDGFLRSVERLAEMVKAGRFLGVHCRASIGRSSVLAVSVLVRLGWDSEKAFAAVQSAMLHSRYSGPAPVGYSKCSSHAGMITRLKTSPFHHPLALAS